MALVGAEGKFIQQNATITPESQQSSKIKNPGQSGENSPFAKLLETQGEDMNAMMDLLQDQQGMHASEKAVSADFSANIDDMQGWNPSSTRMAETLVSEVNLSGLRLEMIADRALSGEKFSNQDMILMQAAMHDATFKVEMTSKFMDAAGKSVRGLLQQSMQ